MTIELDLSKGDVVLGGKFKNKRIVIKTIGKDELGQPTINGKPLLKVRIEKDLPEDKQSKQTKEDKMKLTKAQIKEMIREQMELPSNNNMVTYEVTLGQPDYYVVFDGPEGMSEDEILEKAISEMTYKTFVDRVVIKR